LTIATEVADLKRIGISTEQGAILLATMEYAHINNQLDFIGIIDIVSGKEQTLDIGLLAAMPPGSFYHLMIEFIKNNCPSCNELETATFNQIKNWIEFASTLPILVSY